MVVVEASHLKQNSGWCIVVTLCKFQLSLVFLSFFSDGTDWDFFLSTYNEPWHTGGAQQMIVE